MFLLMKSEFAWLDMIRKARVRVGSSQPSTSPPSPGGGDDSGPKGGPGGSPRPGHKYVNRTWTGDHWEYEYSQEPHAERHGVEHLGHRDGYSMDLHESAASAASPEEAYHTSRRAHHLQAPSKGQKMVHQASHPADGRPIEFHVKPAKQNANNPHGLRIWVHEQSTATDRKGNPKPGKKVVGAEKGFSGWAGLEAWLTQERLGGTTHHQDAETGAALYSTMPIAGKIDAKNDILHPPAPKMDVQTRIDEQGREVTERKAKAPYSHKVVYHKGSPLHESGKGARKNASYHYSKEEADARLARIVSDQQAIQETAVGARPPMSERMQTSNPVDILDEGQLPMMADPEDPRKAAVQFESDEQRGQFLNYLGGHVLPQTRYLADRLTNSPHLQDKKEQLIPQLTGLGVDVGAEFSREGFDPTAFNFENTDSPVYRFLERALTNYNPSASRATPEEKAAGRTGLRSYAFASLPNRFAAYAGKTAGLDNAQIRSLSDEADEMARDRAGYQASVGGVESGYQAGAEQMEAAAESAWGGNLDEWRTTQTSALDRWTSQQTDPDTRQLGEAAAQAVREVQHADQARQFGASLNRYADEVIKDPAIRDQFKNEVLQMFKSLIDGLAKAIAADNAVRFLMGTFHKAKNEPLPPEDHQYSHMDGGPDHPRYYYQDSLGNQMRYTNAPQGHQDYNPVYGDPVLHATEPTPEGAPEFFTPDGRKLTRAPYPGAEMQWNPNYHTGDPQNLWAGRWVNPATGDHEHAYIDADIRQQPKLQMHQDIAMVDAQLPKMRNYVAGLLSSHQVKDRILGFMMALVDQGHFRLQEVVNLRVIEVNMRGNVVQLGKRQLYLDPELLHLLQALLAGKRPDQHLFLIPKPSKSGQLETFRRIGPHTLSNVFELCGTPIHSLHRYHASQAYSMALQRFLGDGQCSFGAAREYALLECADQLGHDFQSQPDVNVALRIISETMIDPIVQDVICRNCDEQGIGHGDAGPKMRYEPTILLVQSGLNDRTREEKVFGQWLHAYPAHTHAEEKNPYAAAA